MTPFGHHRELRLRRRGTVAVLFLAVLWSATACAPTRVPGPMPVRGVNPVLRPGDLVRLGIWREPDLSGDFPVDEDDTVVFPKIGSLAVGALSTDSVKSLLLSRYSADLRDPSITVTFLRRVNVLGEVKNPGLYHVDPTMTVADVLALAGGITPDGNPGRVELIRHGQQLAVGLTQDSRVSDSPLRSGDQLRVPRRSWLSRNTSVVAAAITATAILVASVIRL